MTDEEIQRELGIASNPSPPGQAGENLEGVDPGVGRFIRNANFLVEQAKDTNKSDVLNFLNNIGKGFVDAVLGAPQALGSALAFGGAGLQTAAETPFKEGDFGARFSQNLEEQRDQLPASALINAPRVDAVDLQSGFDAGLSAAREAIGNETLLTGTLGERFNQAQFLNEVQGRANEAVRPFSTGAGEVTGTALGVLAGRAPVVRGRNPRLKAKRLKARRLDIKPPRPIGPHERKLNDIVTNYVIEKLPRVKTTIGRGAGRVAEAGLEGLAAGFLQGDPNPIQLAAFGAGTQAVGSASLTLLSKPLAGLSSFFGTAFIASRMFDAVGPDEQNIFESADFATEKTLAAFILGLSAATIGLGRVRGPQAEKFPVFFDALTAVPRNSVFSLVAQMSQARQEGDVLPQRVLDKLVSNPDFFNRNQVNSLGRAIMSDKKDAFIKEVNRLMEESPDFQKRVGDL
ncbi:hypothetical protein GWO43_16035 [candidate division KSB1 bacterium]|nr:hypothetical protein [candidate division KSB1 bacterium]NIS25461.1 hypothetical protein [candidate division KSB1 bacterium]NIT72353.1 hypothetical protein [candidate division KSB1 bacterium]NIU26138.1 hypothetical protein [candidate division KSB1 bacterium]NIU89494.1 hypothetical protein [candidate division KSB1 bacterium]